MKQLIEEYNNKFANHDITSKKEAIAEIQRLLWTIINDDYPYISIDIQYRKTEDDQRQVSSKTKGTI